MDYVRIHAEALECVSDAINLVLSHSLSLAGLHAPSCSLSLPRVRNLSLAVSLCTTLCTTLCF